MVAPRICPANFTLGFSEVHVVHGAHAHDGEQPAHHTGVVDGPIGAVDVEPGPAEKYSPATSTMSAAAMPAAMATPPMRGVGFLLTRRALG